MFSENAAIDNRTFTTLHIFSALQRPSEHQSRGRQRRICAHDVASEQIGRLDEKVAYILRNRWFVRRRRGVTRGIKCLGRIGGTARIMGSLGRWAWLR